LGKSTNTVKSEKVKFQLRVSSRLGSRSSRLIGGKQQAEQISMVGFDG